MIDIQSLTKVFADGSARVVALDDVSLRVENGEVFGIIGMSGAGKSTLLRCLSVLEKPTQGRVLLDGEDLAALSGEALRRAYMAAGFVRSDAGCMTSITLIVISAVTTALGWYHKLATKAGAGTLVPITGFANAVVSQAIEARCEGYVTGVGAKMFQIAGPVIVYGVLASTAWGALYYFLRPFI